MLSMQIPTEYFVTAMICANEYNSRRDTHGTFAYASKSKDICRIVLESHIFSRGGVTEDSLKFNLKNFISHIDPFENIILSGIKELGPDSNFLKSGGWDVLWEAAGAFFRGMALADRQT